MSDEVCQMKYVRWSMSDGSMSDGSMSDEVCQILTAMKTCTI